MISFIFPRARKGRDEAEKPFWISFADLMTALMVMFLVSMTAVMLTVTRKVDAIQEREEIHRRDLEAFLRDMKLLTASHPGVEFESQRSTFTFSEKAYFGVNSSTLNRDAELMLRQFVPEVLRRADTELGRRMLKRIVVEGFTDETGTYLYNLNLSLQRSQRVLCALLSGPGPGMHELTPVEKEQVQKLFVVGGYSSNSLRRTRDESRRIELRLEVFRFDEDRGRQEPEVVQSIGLCALD
jgi:flagellar motor protein MotB